MEEVDVKIEKIVHTFKTINYGDDFDTSDTWEAARLLEQLPIFDICDDIVKLSSVNDKWKLAIKLTKEISKIVFIAEECAGYRVDGTDGDFCILAAEDVQYLWKQICQETLISTEKIDEDLTNTITIEFEHIFGKFADLSFIKSKPGEFPEDRVFHEMDEDGNIIGETI